MPPPAPNLPYSPQDQDALLNQLLTRLRGKVVTAVAGVFDRLNVSGDITTRNMVVREALTTRVVRSIITARMWQNAAQSIPSDGAFHQILFDNNSFDPSLMIVNRQFRIAVPGRYELHGRAGCVTAVATRMIASIFVNGSEASRGSDYATASAPTSGSVVTDVLSLNVGDLVDLRLLQNSGGALNTDTGGGIGSVTVHLAIHYLSS